MSGTWMIGDDGRTIVGPGITICEATTPERARAIVEMREALTAIVRVLDGSRPRDPSVALWCARHALGMPVGGAR